MKLNKHHMKTYQHYRELLHTPAQEVNDNLQMEGSG